MFGWFFLTEIRFASEQLYIWRKMFQLASILNIRLEWCSVLKLQQPLPHLISSWHLWVETLQLCAGCLAFWEKVTLPLKKLPLEHLTWRLFLFTVKMAVLIFEKEQVTSVFFPLAEVKRDISLLLNTRASFFLWSMKSSVVLLCSEIHWRDETKTVHCKWKCKNKCT